LFDDFWREWFTSPAKDESIAAGRGYNDFPFLVLSEQDQDVF
jgi:hypothetical protein